MALTSVLTRVNEAIMGQPTRFTLAVTNGGASAVSVTSVLPLVTSAAGQVGIPVVVAGPYVSPNESTPSTTGGQFNVSISAAGTHQFEFNVTLHGAAIRGAPSNAIGQFLVGVAITDSDGNVTGPPALEVAINYPTFGLPPGSPPNPDVAIGSLWFSDPQNAVFAL